MTTLNRWRLASALFAALAVGFALHGRAAPAGSATTTSGRAALWRPIRVPAAAIGVSAQELVDQMLAARTADEMLPLADKLGAIGGNDAVDAVLPMLDDPRRGVPTVAASVLGHIATDHAIDVLLQHATDDRPEVRDSAIRALGTTHATRAEDRLVEMAGAGGDPVQAVAIEALGLLASDRAVAVLLELARGGDSDAAISAVTALSVAATPAARIAIRALVDAPNAKVAGTAMGSLDTVDADLLERLIRIAQSGDVDRSDPALTALARAGEAALPALRELASRGSAHTRALAVSAIGEVGSDDAIEALGEILRTFDTETAKSACTALAGRGGPRARELLIEAALSERARETGALDQLLQLRGEDVDQALLEIAVHGSIEERRVVLPRLIKSGRDDAFQLAVDMTKDGSSDRLQAIGVLEAAGTEKAHALLLRLASDPETKMAALTALAHTHPGDPEVARMLQDTLLNGQSEDSRAAAMALAGIGTDAARQALLSAASGSDHDLATTAIAALGNMELSEPVKAALLSAAHSDPKLRDDVVRDLLRAGAPEGLRLAGELIGGDDVDAATTAVALLVDNGSTDARRMIERAAGARSVEVKRAAIRALARAPDEHATETLIGLTRDGDAKTRAEAISALSRNDSSRARQAILDASRSGDVAERTAALDGLAHSADPRALRQLAAMMRDSDPYISRNAISYSRYAGDDDTFRPTLEQIARDPGADPDVRELATMELRRRGVEIAP